MRTRRSAQNLLVNFGYSGVTLLVGLAATPLLLRWLGEARFGAYRVLLDWLGYLTLLELGLSAALPPMLAEALGKSDEGRVQDLLSAGMRSYAKAAVFMITAGLALALAAPYLLSADPSLHSEIRTACVIASLGIIILPLTPFRSLIEAKQRNDRIIALLTLQYFLNIGMALLLAARGWGVTGQFVAQTCSILFFYAVLGFYGFRYHSSVLMGFWRRRTDPELRARIWKMSRNMFALNISSRVSYMTDGIIISLFLGPAAVVPFTLTERLMRVAQGQLQSFSNAVWASMAELHAQGQIEVLRERILELTRFLLALALAALISIAAHNETFVTLWVGAEHYGGLWLTLALAFNVLILSLLNLWSWSITAGGRTDILVRPAVASAVINLIASLLLVNTLGMIGPVIGTTLGFVVVLLGSYGRILCRTFGISGRTFVRNVLPTLGLGALYGAFIFFLSQRHPVAGWPELMTRMVLVSCAFPLLWWLFCLSPSERSRWMSRFRQLRRGSQ